MMDGTLAGIITLGGVAVIVAYLWGVQVGYTWYSREDRREHEQLIRENTVGSPGDIP